MDHPADVLAVGQVVGVVLHDGDQHGIEIGPQLVVDPGQAVNPAGGAAAGEKAGIALGVSAHEAQHPLVGPIVGPGGQPGAVVHQAVGVGVVFQEAGHRAVSGPHHQGGGGGVQVYPAGDLPRRYPVSSVQPDEVGGDPFQQLLP